MHWKLTALLVTASFLAGFSYLATAGDGKEKGGNDKKALQGTWTGSKGDKKAQLTFDGNKFMLEIGGKSASGTFKIEPSKKPKEIDMTVTKGSDDDTKKFEGKTSKGIYELDGDKLQWLAAEPGAEERPEAFPKEAGKAKGLYLILERAKK